MAVAVLTISCNKPAPTMSAAPADSYRAEVESFRRAREAKLTSDVGWLTIAGLHFLTRPATTVGSDAANDVVLPGGTPARVGTFVLAKDGRVSVRLEPGVSVSLLDGGPFPGGPVAFTALECGQIPATAEELRKMQKFFRFGGIAASIVLILFATVVAQVSPRAKPERTLEAYRTQREMQVIKHALEVYKLRTGSYPHALDQLVDAGMLRTRDVIASGDRPYDFSVAADGTVLLAQPAISQ